MDNLLNELDDIRKIMKTKNLAHKDSKDFEVINLAEAINNIKVEINNKLCI